MASAMESRKYRGFTLSEVLIALALLGIIAAFAIPKLMQGRGTAERNAHFKETVASLYAIAEQGRLSGELRPENFTDYMATHLNAIKRCAVANAEGCWEGDSPRSGTPWEINMPGFILPNGVTMAGMGGGSPSSTGYFQDAFLMDWNGLAKPNKLGEDQIWISLCYGRVPCLDSQIGQIVAVRRTAGNCVTLGDCVPETNQSEALYNEVFR